MEFVLLLHAGATLYMAGVIWFVQIVHYPLFGEVGAPGFAAYSAAHTRLTGYAVGPPMLLEMASAIALLLFRPPEVPASMAWAGAALLALIWVSTALMQAPRHRKLASGYNASTHKSLVATNWLRTALWSARGLLALSMLAAAMG